MILSLRAYLDSSEDASLTMTVIVICFDSAMEIALDHSHSSTRSVPDASET